MNGSSNQHDELPLKLQLLKNKISQQKSNNISYIPVGWPNAQYCALFLNIEMLIHEIQQNRPGCKLAKTKNNES